MDSTARRRHDGADGTNGAEELDEVDEHAEKRRISTVVHHVGAPAGSDVWVALVAAAIVVWLAVWMATGQPDWLLHAYEVVVASVTLVMVFVLQHAQGRLTTATQLKLDELLRSLPQADDALIKAETAADEALEEQAEQNIRFRNDVQSDGPGPGPDTADRSSRE